MKKFYILSILTLTTIALIYSCSTEEEDTTPPPSVVATPEPEPEPETPAPTQYTLTVTAGEGGTVSSEGGTYDEGTEVSVTAIPDEGYEFVGWEGSDSAEASITITLNESLSLTANYVQLLVESIQILNPIESLVISRRHKYEVQGTYSNGDTVDLSDLVKLEISDDRVTLLDNNEFTVGKSGDTSINITYQELETSQEFYVNYFEEVLNEFNGEYLTQNNDNAEINVPVVIINFHPTLDGLNIHPGYYPHGAGLIKWYYYAYHDLDENQCTNIDPDNPICQETTLNMYKIRAKEIEMFTKFAIEEGSKFRGYKEQNVFSNINIEIVKYFNFYELVTKNYNRGGNETDIPSPDYDNLFDLINLESLVNIDGVKEVWISLPGPPPPEYNDKLEINIPESNMSSKLTGDVSNSYRIQDDLPIYENTYLVYGMNIDRGPSESVHCRGHQIESQFRHIEENKIYGNELFWNNFVGVDNSGRPIGRCGMTHFPPNTNVDYDYCNQNLVESDIMSWTP
ncbi:MAG: InlB B-repeat-containing protein, partial [Bacteroidia bacterium]